MVLSCGDNKLTDIDLSGNLSLSEASLSFNQLTNLNLKGNSTIMAVACDHNELKELSAEGCDNLQMMVIDHNKLSTESSQHFVESLPKLTEEGGIVFYNQAEYPEADANVISTQTIQLANSKNWYIFDGEDLLTTAIHDVTTDSNKGFNMTNDGRKINFAKGDTNWHLFTSDGLLVTKGYGPTADFTTLAKGFYVLSFGNTKKQQAVKLILK